MDEDEDDFYGGSGQAGDDDQEMSGVPPQIKAEDDNMSEEEEEDSDDDVNFVLEKPEGVKAEPAPQTRATSKAVAIEPSTSQPTKTRQQSAAPKQESTEPQSLAHELTHNGKEGKDYPEVRTSGIDLDENPTWPADGKKITELDIDADLVEHSKPWRLPGTDVTDFFNYGFDEYTWAQYCAKQNDMSKTIADQKEEDNRMKSMLGGMDAGMPDFSQMNPQMMQAMMGTMPGFDPSKIDFSQMMGMAPPGGFGGQQGSNSPMPQGQGFQPPLGPTAGQGANPAMEGFNAQQMSMMPQQEQQGYGSGNRGRGRRGRGYY